MFAAQKISLLASGMANTKTSAYSVVAIAARSFPNVAEPFFPTHVCRKRKPFPMSCGHPATPSLFGETSPSRQSVHPNIDTTIHSTQSPQRSPLRNLMQHIDRREVASSFGFRRLDKSNQMGFGTSIEDGSVWWGGTFFSFESGFETFFDKTFANVGNGVCVAMKLFSKNLQRWDSATGFLRESVPATKSHGDRVRSWLK